MIETPEGRVDRWHGRRARGSVENFLVPNRPEISIMIHMMSKVYYGAGYSQRTRNTVHAAENPQLMSLHKNV